MHIVIDYNGSTATCFVEGKLIKDLDRLDVARVFSAFKCIEKDFNREYEYNKSGVIYKSGSSNITKL